MKLPMFSRLTDRWSETAEEIAARAEESRELIAERAEESRAMLAQRAAQIREEWNERVDAETVTRFAGWTLVSTGVALGVTSMARGKRGAGAWLLPGLLALAGFAVLSGGTMWRRRAYNIGEAEARVRSELEQLDPVARFQVLRDVAGESVPFVRHIQLRRN